MRSSQGEDKALPLTLAEEYDLSAFVPLSTTFSPIPPPSVEISPLPQRLAKIRSALATLIEHQPVLSPSLILFPIIYLFKNTQSWAFLLFDEATKTFTATISMVIKTPTGDPRSQSQRSSGSGSSSYSQQRSRLDAANGHEVDENVDPLIEEEAEENEEEEGEEEEEEEAEEEEEQEVEEDQEEKKADESMDMDSPPLQRGLAETTEPASGKHRPPPGFSITTPARCELNDDEIAADEDEDDDDMDEVILFNPFARPNQNHTAMPIGGERNLRTAKAEGSLLREEVVVAQPPLRGNQSEHTLPTPLPPSLLQLPPPPSTTTPTTPPITTMALRVSHLSMCLRIDRVSTSICVSKSNAIKDPPLALLLVRHLRERGWPLRQDSLRFLRASLRLLKPTATACFLASSHPLLLRYPKGTLRSHSLL